MSKRHRRKREYKSTGENYLNCLRNAMIGAMRAQYGDQFTPEMEALFCRDGGSTPDSLGMPLPRESGAP